MEKIKSQSNRLVSLDYLRGYFIIVIIIDHLSRFPSAWQFITGQGLLWATAAEGFLMISGLMVGYVRGFKGLTKPFKYVAARLMKRSILLYAWMVIGSLMYVALTWNLTTLGDMPWYNAPTGDWSTVIHQIITMQMPHVWVHFLYLYAIYLACSIPAVWLLRQNQPWIVACLSLIGYFYGIESSIEWLRLQVIFFIPAIAGFYLPTIIRWWRRYPHRRVVATITTIVALITLCVSAVFVFNESVIPVATQVNQHFAIGQFSISRILVSALWFIALIFAFQRFTPWLQRHTHGLMEYFGTHSLTAYIAHGIVLCAVSVAIPIKDSFFINTIAGFAALLGVYALIKLPGVRSLLPR